MRSQQLREAIDESKLARAFADAVIEGAHLVVSVWDACSNAQLLRVVSVTHMLSSCGHSESGGLSIRCAVHVRRARLKVKLWS